MCTKIEVSTTTGYTLTTGQWTVSTGYTDSLELVATLSMVVPQQIFFFHSKAVDQVTGKCKCTRMYFYL